MAEDRIEIDGSLGEGGGQILRSSLALSVITGRPVHLYNIRANRPKSGLAAQHLMSVRAAREISNADVTGDALGSREITFSPGPVASGDYYFEISTAGATALVLHTIYLPLALAEKPSTITIRGGTHVKAAPCFHFLETTWNSYLARMGIHVDLEMVHPGFYPRGGGMIRAVIQPIKQIRGGRIQLKCDRPMVSGFSAVAGLKSVIAEKQAKRAIRRLQENGIRSDITIQSWAGGPGSVIALILNTKPVPTMFFALGERGLPAEKVADKAAREVLAHIESGITAVDEHSADQILLPLSLASGESSYEVARVSRHLLTNISIVKKFQDVQVDCDGAEGAAGVVKICES